MSSKDPKAERKEGLKLLIKKLHSGATPEQLKTEFKDVIDGASPTEVAQIEEQLIKEGMPAEELHKFCDVHIALMKDALEAQKPLAPPGHPVRILMEEHKLILELAESLRATPPGDLETVEEIVRHLKGSESHYLREENVLFPYLERHGITQPPAIMWMEHDQIRALKREIYSLVEGRDGSDKAKFAEHLGMLATALFELLSMHFYKENNILYPAGLEVIPEGEWKDIRAQFDEMGYCCFTPEEAIGKGAKGAKPERATKAVKEVGGMIRFETGELTLEQLEAMLDTMPVDFTFVDPDDTVRYFSNSKERVFARTKAIIGRKVQNCHPQKSYAAVNRILEGFKSGKMDRAEFWLTMGGKVVHIRYFAVRKDGKYMGCLEVSQDITEIQKIKGEKRLLD